MKRITAVVITWLTVFLSSCEVHCGNKSWQVPWYYIAVPVAVWSIIVCVAAHIYIIKKSYKCPGCGTVFRPKWYDISAWLHIGDARYMRCPNCGRKGFCSRAD